MSISKIENVATKETESEMELNSLVSESTTETVIEDDYQARNAEFLAEYDTDEKQIKYYTECMKTLFDEFRIDHSYSTYGCRANVEEWYNNKKGLFELLRKHPMWDE